MTVHKKAGDKAKARLSDMEIEEVSLVDRAANRRRFLVTKDENMKLVADGRGGFTEVSKDGSEDNAGKEDANKGDEGSEAKGSNGDESNDGDGEKVDTSKCLNMLGAVAARVIEVAKDLKENGKELPESFDGEVASMVGEAMKARRLTPSRRDRFAAAMGEMNKLFSELAGASDDKGKGKDKTEKSEEFAKLESTLVELTETVKKQAETIKKFEDQPGSSNALSVDGSANDGSDDDTAWPLDMNSEEGLSKGANEKRGTSFY